MARLEQRRFSESERVQEVPRGRIELVDLGDRTVGRITYEPGWRWTSDMKPVAGGDSCQFHHVGVTMSGRLHVVTEDGQELDLRPGDVFDIPPGHDGWVVGDEPWVAVDFEAFQR